MATLSLSQFLVLSFNSLSYAAILFLLASGLSLIFGVMRIVNLAHAAIFLFGGYLALEFYNLVFGNLSIEPRLIQLVAWVVLFFAWKGLARFFGWRNSGFGLLGVYIVAELLAHLVFGTRIYPLFAPKLALKPVDHVNIVGLFAAMIFSIFFVVLGGMFVERFFLRRLGQDTLSQVLVTIGFAFILQDGSLYTWGGDNFMFKRPWPMDKSIVVGGLFLPEYRLFMIIIAVVVAIALYLSIERTRVGAIMRAAVDDPEMARGIGINTNIVQMATFAIGSALAAMGGVVGGAFFGVYPGLDFEVLPYAFAVVIIGGLGSLEGVIVGSIVVGFMENFGTALFPELSYFALFAPMAIILAVKPTGLFGRG